MTEPQLSAEMEKEWNAFFNHAHINQFDRDRAFTWWNEKLATALEEARNEGIEIGRLESFEYEREKVLSIVENHPTFNHMGCEAILKDDLLNQLKGGK